MRSKPDGFGSLGGFRYLRRCRRVLHAQSDDELKRKQTPPATDTQGGQAQPAGDAETLKKPKAAEGGDANERKNRRLPLPRAVTRPQSQRP